MNALALGVVLTVRRDAAPDPAGDCRSGSAGRNPQRGSTPSLRRYECCPLRCVLVRRCGSIVLYAALAALPECHRAEGVADGLPWLCTERVTLSNRSVALLWRPL